MGNCHLHDFGHRVDGGLLSSRSAPLHDAPRHPHRPCHCRHRGCGCQCALRWHQHFHCCPRPGLFIYVHIQRVLHHVSVHLHVRSLSRSPLSPHCAVQDRPSSLHPHNARRARRCPEDRRGQDPFMMKHHYHHHRHRWSAESSVYSHSGAFIASINIL